MICNYSGVYQIRCTASGKRYIGSSQNVGERLRKHFRMLRRGTHDNNFLQNTFGKYGEESLEPMVLLRCSPPDCVLFEQRAIDALKPELNILTQAGSVLGYRHTAKTIELIRAAGTGRKRTPESIEKTRQANTGRKHSQERKEKNGKAHRKENLSPETIAKMKASHIGKIKSPETIEKSRLANTGKKRTAETKESIRKALLGKKKTPEAIEKMKLSQRRRRGWPNA